jgi:hypothetical protein
MQQAALSRRERQIGEVNVVLWVLGFVCDNLRDLRETLGFLCADRLSTLACILPQIAQITQRNAASCIISQRKTVCDVVVVLGFVCVISEICERYWGFFVQLIEYSYVNILPQIAQIPQRNAAGCIITQRKTDR